MCDVDLQMHQSGEQSVSIYGKLKERRGDPKKWMEVIRQYIEVKGLSEGILLDRNE